jgi:hypothetical protein
MAAKPHASFDRVSVLLDSVKQIEGPLLARLYGPAVRCKPDLSKWRVVLRFCIRPLHGAFVLLAIMDIRAHPK